MKRNKSAFGKATIAYPQQKLSYALDDKMCNALDEYKNRQENAKIQTTIHQCRQFYVTDFLEHAPATASIAMSESTLDLDKNIKEGLSGPNEFNVKREKAVMMPVSIVSSTENDLPSFTLLYRGTAIEITMDIAPANDIDTLLPIVLSSWHARRTLCAMSPRDSAC